LEWKRKKKEQEEREEEVSCVAGQEKKAAIIVPAEILLRAEVGSRMSLARRDGRRVELEIWENQTAIVSCFFVMLSYV